MRFTKNYLSPARVATTHIILWAVFLVLSSDRLLALWFANPTALAISRFPAIKSCFYIILTAILLYQLVRTYMVAMDCSHRQMLVKEEWLRAIVETSKDGILVFDREGKVLLGNAAAQTSLGLAKGSHHRDLARVTTAVGGEPLAKTNCPFLRTLESGQPVYGTSCAIANLDGSQAILSLNAAPLLDGSGAIDGVVMCFIEKSDRRATETINIDEELADAKSRAKSEFIAHASHELRTPLSAILGMSKMLQQEIYGSLNTKQKDYIARIKSSGDYLLELINNILDISKIEAGKQELNLECVGTSELCQFCLSLMQDRASDRGLKLTSRVEPEARSCIADRRCLKQMLLNLLSNAIEFTPAGEVSLIVKKHSGGICFTVADTGIGIEPDQIPLLFQPFQQLNNNRNRQSKGTGLGLCLTRDLARLHGGDATVKSALGQGSEFTIFIPQQPIIENRKEEALAR